MPSTPSLINQLSKDYTNIAFQPGAEYRWSPSERTVYFDPHSSDDASLLHEVAHALLGHTSYTRDITLLAMERDAWNHAVSLAPRYEVSVPDDLVEDALDTYRDWLHARSTCPDCGATGIQSQQYQYRCIACSAIWRVNDARLCALRRYKQ